MLRALHLHATHVFVLHCGSGESPIIFKFYGELFLRVTNVVLVEIVVEVVAWILSIIKLLVLELILILLFLLNELLLHLLLVLLHLLLLLHKSIEILRFFRLSEEHLRRMALTDDVKGLLNVLQDHFAWFFKPSYLHFNDFADGFFVLFDVFYTIVVLDDTGNT